MTTRTLEDRLRERARRRLSGNLGRAFADFQSSIDFPNQTIVRLEPKDVMRTRDGDIRIEAWRLLSLLKDQIYRNRVEETEEKEIEIFLSDVDSVKKQLNELGGES